MNLDENHITFPSYSVNQKEDKRRYLNNDNKYMETIESVIQAI